MASSRTSHAAYRALRTSRSILRVPRSFIYQQYRQAHSTSSNNTHRVPKWIFTIPVIGILAMSDFFRSNSSAAFETPTTNDGQEIEIEISRKKKGASKDEIRDLISSQHTQVRKSWENPGVYAWGSNTGKVVAPDSDEAFIKTPKRIPFFNDILLRDLNLDRNSGAAITESGDLLQWGKGYSETETPPTMTLKGKDLISLSMSRDRILALAKSGKVYSLPLSKSEQEEGPKLSEDSWVPFWKGRASVSYRLLEPTNLGYRERVTAISGGLDHLLMLTNSGKVYSAASSSDAFPSRGQLGVPGLTFTTRPEGSHDMAHEIGTLRGFEIAAISAGDYHSLALDKDGRVFSFGDNSNGQLGFEYSSESPCIDAPSLINFSRLYQGTNQLPCVTSVSAGGLNSFFTVDATRVLGRFEEPSEARGLGRITADVWASGQGIRGSLGNGRWTHLQGTPTKISTLSGLFEYDEIENVAIPIRMARISVGSNHASATMANVTYLDANQKSSEHDTNWGADVVWWGSNEFYQLGTGKKNNINTPMYITPLDMDAEKELGRSQKHRFHVTPKHKVKVGGRTVNMEQRVECGRNVTAVYSAV